MLVNVQNDRPQSLQVTPEREWNRIEHASPINVCNDKSIDFFEGGGARQWDFHGISVPYLGRLASPIVYLS